MEDLEKTHNPEIKNLRERMEKNLISQSINEIKQAIQEVNDTFDGKIKAYMPEEIEFDFGWGTKVKVFINKGEYHE